jgi:sugar O-acyltransferase (sialic acid O-acetyltransferase NeuD family)
MDESVPLHLVIVCAGGRASEVASYIRDIQGRGATIVVHGYVDDHRFDSVFEGAPILGGIKELGAFLAARRETQYAYVTAIGDNRSRADLVRRIDDLGATNLEPWVLRHPAACIGDSVTIGPGSSIAPAAVITSRGTVGSHCLVGPLCSISHDATLDSFVHVSPGALIGSYVTLGEGSFIGAGATIMSDTKVGEWSSVGPGAVVTDDVPPHVTVMGSPARIVQRHGRSVRQAAFSLK